MNTQATSFLFSNVTTGEYRPATESEVAQAIPGKLHADNRSVDLNDGRWIIAVGDGAHHDEKDNSVPSILEIETNEDGDIVNSKLIGYLL